MSQNNLRAVIGNHDIILQNWLYTGLEYVCERTLTVSQYKALMKSKSLFKDFAIWLLLRTTVQCLALCNTFTRSGLSEIRYIRLRAVGEGVLRPVSHASTVLVETPRMLANDF